MRRPRPVLVLSAGLTTAVLSLGAVASADTAPAGCRTVSVVTDVETGTTKDVTACRTDTWLVGSATKADNLAGTGASATPTWDLTKPDKSVQAGAGSGYGTVAAAAIAAPGDPTFTPVFTGKVTGPLDNLAADLYLSAPVYSATGTPWPMTLVVSVDGTTVFSQTAAEIDVPMEANPTETTGTGATKRIRFALTDVAQAMQDNGIALEGEHTVSMQIINRYYGDGHTVFLYDTTEVPAGIVFNAPASSLSPYTQVSAAPPVF